ncbi:MAG: ABC transporter permease, partial [Candidatus Scatosoma sp.]
QVTESSIDFTAVMSGMASRMEDMPDLSRLDDEVYVDSFITKIAGGMTVKNDISDEYLAYVREMDGTYCNAISYDYGEGFADNLFTSVEVKKNDESDELITQYRSLSSIKQFYTDELTKKAEEYKELAGMISMLGDVVSKMPGTADFSDEKYGDYVLSQYDVVKGEFPKAANEAVIVIGKDNTATDLLMAQLGFIEETKFLTYFNIGENGADTGAGGIDESKLISFDDLIGKKYALYYNDAVYEKDAAYGEEGHNYPFKYVGERTGEKANLNAAESEGVEVKITGVLRLKEDLDYGCLQKGLNLTENLAERFIAENKKSEIVRWINEESNVKDKINQKIAEMNLFLPEDKKIAPLETDLYLSPAEYLNSCYLAPSALANYMPGADFSAFGFSAYVNISVEKALRALSGSDKVTTVSFYPSDFDTKEKVIAYLDAWNASHETAQKVTYTDTVGTMMSMVQTMLNAVTYVLVAFTAISLVVSSVMIGIITYVSVVERTKEIGVLRSLGARKKDIRHLFNAETFLIGLFAGLIGVGGTYLLSLPINLLLKSLTGISSLAALPLWQGLVMIAVSVSLTLLSGLIPASSAAKKDPVVALRTE